MDTLTIGNSRKTHSTRHFFGEYHVEGITSNSLAKRIADENMHEKFSGKFDNSLRTSHRLEDLGTICGVTYINDSRSTNVNGTWYALEMMTKPVIWIAGGVDRGNNYTCIEPLVKKKVKGMVYLGIDSYPFQKRFGEIMSPIISCADMFEAVRFASKLANPGDVVLFSPSGASFDLFDNYEDRGRQFCAHVANL